MPRKGQGRITGRPLTTQVPQPAGGVRLETFVPWTLVKRGANKKVFMPSGAPGAVRVEAVQPRNVEMETADLKVLGLAHYWQHLLDTGKIGSLTEIAGAEGMDLGQVSRIARFAWVVEALLSGKEHGLELTTKNAPASE